MEEEGAGLLVAKASPERWRQRLEVAGKGAARFVKSSECREIFSVCMSLSVSSLQCLRF